MATQMKTLCKVRTSSFKHLSTIYENSIDKQKSMGILNIVSGVKYYFRLVVCNVCYKLKGVINTCTVLLNSLNDTS